MARNNRWRFFLSLITTTVFLFPELTLGQNECKEGGAGGYTKIDDPRRSIESIFKHGQSAICDRAFAWGWYRFDSYTGGKMPEQKVDQMRCGTVHPIWMRGTHPTVKEGTVNRTACINFYDMLNGCLSSLNIRVRNCNGFFVYYLGPTHSCSLAYCAGKSLHTFARLNIVTGFTKIVHNRTSHQPFIRSTPLCDDCNFQTSNGYYV